MFEWSISMHVHHIVLMNTEHIQYKSYQVAVSYMVEKSSLSAFTKTSVEHVDECLASCST